MKKILLFDTIDDGHHPEYLSHLIRYWLRTQPVGQLVVVAPASFNYTVEELTAHNPGQASVQFDAIPQEDIELVHHEKGLKRSLAEWKLVLSYVNKHQPDHTLLMYFDVLQPGMLMGPQAPCPVSGIYFRPDFYYAGSSSLKDWFRIFRKKATLRRLLQRKTLTNLFSLDHAAVPLVQAMSSGVRVLPLPDPVKQYTVSGEEVSTLRESLQIEPGRTVFLVFGYLDERKGIEPLLDALRLVNPALHHRLCILLAGPAKPEFRRAIEPKIAALPPDIQVISDFREIKGSAIQRIFNLADVVLTLYKNHVGMASVLVRAAVSGKPVLSSDYGYMGYLVQQEQLGMVVDSISPTAICQGLELAVTDGIPYAAKNLPVFAAHHTDQAFAETIFSQL